MIPEETLNLIEDNIYIGDLNIQRVRLIINDQAVNANPKELQDHILCSIAHLQSAADYLEIYIKQ